ncbi:MAG: primosomal protein N', partial [Fidelibacterota bacterium]
QAWKMIKDGRRRIVVGARSAVFAPVENLGLIVVDEEQEASYKQEEPDPKYNGRDVAVVRGKIEGAVVVLGSATPSLESFYNVKAGKYTLLHLTERYDKASPPRVEIVNLEHERIKNGYRSVVLSQILKEKIEEKLEKGEQILLLQNRRGFSPFIMCQDCRYTETCERCNITLTYHRKGALLKCHYCHFSKPVPLKCPQCMGLHIIYAGVGTQKVEEEILKLFPEARVCRMDLDTTIGRGSHRRLLEEYERGEYSVLVGTQMIAKGLDFENVTLVGVISADTSIYLPDFRSAERTFQLISQVAGRAGRRRKQGEVIIQTSIPENENIIAATQNDFRGFYKKEFTNRKELSYPPFSRLINLEFRGRTESEVVEMAEEVCDILRSGEDGYIMLGPSPAPIERIKRYYRWRIIIKVDKDKDPSGDKIRKFLREKLGRYLFQPHPGRVRLSLDVDPVHML